MLRSNRATRLGLMALAAVGAISTAPPAASADPVASDIACAFGGTQTLNPPIPIPPAGIEQDGVLTLDAAATCVAVDEGVTAPFQVNIVANGGYSNLVAAYDDVAADGCMWASPDPTGEIGSTPCPALPVNPANQAALTTYMVLSSCGSTGNLRFAVGGDIVNGVAQIGGGGCGPAIEAGQVAPDAYNLVGAASALPNPLVNGAFVLETA